MSNPLELSLSDSFNRERFTRAISASEDVKELRQIATVLLNGWLTQRAATQWVMRQAMSKPATISTEPMGFSVRPDSE